MKSWKSILGIFAILAILISCQSSDNINAGIGLTTCDHVCGQTPTCQTSRGDLEKKGKTDVSFPFGVVSETGTRDYPESIQSVNATLTATLEGAGSIKVSVLTADGRTVTAVATKDSPAIITDTFTLKFNKEKPSTVIDSIESAKIVGIVVEPIGIPAVGVQLNLVINECTDNWCTRTHPNCVSN